MKFHLKTWSLLSGMTLSLALVGGCSHRSTSGPDKSTACATGPQPTPEDTAGHGDRDPGDSATGRSRPPPRPPAPAADAPKDEPKKEEAPK